MEAETENKLDFKDKIINFFNIYNYIFTYFDNKFINIY